MMCDGFVGVFDEALVQERWPGVSAVNRGGLAALFEHRSDAAELEQGFGIFKALAAGTEGSQEPGTLGTEGGRSRNRTKKARQFASLAEILLRSGPKESKRKDL